MYSLQMIFGKRKKNISFIINQLTC